MKGFCVYVVCVVGGEELSWKEMLDDCAVEGERVPPVIEYTAVVGFPVVGELLVSLFVVALSVLGTFVVGPKVVGEFEGEYVVAKEEIPWYVVDTLLRTSLNFDFLFSQMSKKSPTTSSFILTVLK